MSVSDWDERYRSGELPWDTGSPDDELTKLVGEETIPLCAAMDVGCGTGTNVIWLARQGFNVVGVDISPTAIEMAGKKVVAAGIDCTLFALDILEETVAGRPFGFVFDRGCFHSFDSPEERASFAVAVERHLEPDGLWLSLLGSADDSPREVGPPQRSATDIILAVEPQFEILELKTTYFNVGQPEPPRAWRCLMRKRPATR